MAGRLAYWCWWPLLAAAAYAHAPSDSHLSIAAQPDRSALWLRWDIALVDLEHAIGLDEDGDGAITWGEVKRREAAIRRYALEHVELARAGTACPVAFESLQIAEHGGSRYAVLNARADCAARSGAITVHYRLLFDVDSTHRGLLVFRNAGQTQTTVFSPENTTWSSAAP